MCKDLSARYYQKNKERLQKRLVKGIKVFLEQTKIINYFHNILRLFDVLPMFLFITSEVMRNYYL